MEIERDRLSMGFSILKLIPQRELHDACPAARHNPAKVPVIKGPHRVAQCHVVESAIKLATELDFTQSFRNGKRFCESERVSPATGACQEVPSRAPVPSRLVGRKSGDVEILQDLVVTAGIGTFG